jgi:hypothetical protein
LLHYLRLDDGDAVDFADSSQEVGLRGETGAFPRAKLLSTKRGDDLRDNGESCWQRPSVSLWRCLP